MVPSVCFPSVCVFFFFFLFTRWLLNVVLDAGKSTLSGNLLFRTGVVDDRTIQKYEKEAKEKNRESWFYAYIMDTNEEERAKVHFDHTHRHYAMRTCVTFLCMPA